MIICKMFYYLFSGLFVFIHYAVAIILGIKLRNFYPEIHWLQQILCIIMFYYATQIIAIFSTIAHELGHFSAGRLAKLKINEFYAYPILITSENNKLKMKFIKDGKFSDISGHCDTRMMKDVNYNNTSLKIVVLSGMIANLMIAVISGFLLTTVSNIFIKDLLIIVLFVNLYFIFLNMIPMIYENGAESDFLRFLNARKDSQYFKKYYDFLNLQELQANGENIQFECPESFTTITDVSYGILEVQRLIDEQLEEDAKRLIIKIKKEAYEFLPESYISILNSSLFYCELFSEKPDIELMSKIWEKSVKKTSIEQAKTNSALFMYLYAGSILVENNKELALEYAKQYKEANSTQESIDVWEEWCKFLDELKEKFTDSTKETYK